MTDTIKIPAVGPVKKPFVIAGIGVVGGVLVYAYWRRSKTEPSTADSAATATPSASDAIDPSTGLTYAEEAAGGGGVGYGYPNYGGYSGGSSYAPYGYDMYGNPLPPPVSSGSNGVYTTNNDWATAAETALENGGVTIAVSTTAISRVLGGLSVTSAQRDLFMQAVGVLGEPPQGYHKPIKLVDTPSSPAPSTGTLKAPTGLKVTKVDRTHVTLTWNKVSGAAHYRVYRSDVSTNVGDSGDNAITVGGLAHNHTYHFHVRALDAHGHLGAPSASVAARTHK